MPRRRCWQRFGRTPKADLHETLLTMGMEDGAQYLIREYALPLDRNGYLDVMREVIAQLYEKVELKPGVRDTLARLRAEGRTDVRVLQHMEQPVPHRADPPWASTNTLISTSRRGVL